MVDPSESVTKPLETKPLEVLYADVVYVVIERDAEGRVTRMGKTEPVRVFARDFTQSLSTVAKKGLPDADRQGD